jgi:SPP1 family predicted phage head-tail adaptor
MKIGQLRHRLEIQEQRSVRDEWGNQVSEWFTVATAWAAIEPIRGEEYWAAGAQQGETIHRVTMRYVPGVTPKHRLLFGDRILEIESTLNLEERSRLLELLCKERLNGQSG